MIKPYDVKISYDGVGEKVNVEVNGAVISGITSLSVVATRQGYRLEIADVDMADYAKTLAGYGLTDTAAPGTPPVGSNKYL